MSNWSAPEVGAVGVAVRCAGTLGAGPGSVVGALPGISVTPRCRAVPLAWPGRTLGNSRSFPDAAPGSLVTTTLVWPLTEVIMFSPAAAE
ncbi:hypothetical protein, partial [Streptomyces europaeiscabiei]|uniref:hypothetical protein n=1 Tax=Streptomyces europaeiscabiei TaxID=146819 RepID=UPI0038D49C34